MSFILCYEYRSSCDMIKSQRIFSIQPNFQKSTHSSPHNHIFSYKKWWREIPYRESNSVNKSNFFVIIISRPVNVVALVTKLFLCVTSDERTQNYVNVPKYARLFGFWRPLKFPHSMLVQVDQWDLTRMAGWYSTASEATDGNDICTSLSLCVYLRYGYKIYLTGYYNTQTRRRGIFETCLIDVTT